jgi:protein-tyrosine phosphatase
MAGMQRSAACMAMFLILKGEIHTADAIHFIRAKRPIAFNPSANFLKSIEYFDELLHNNILPRVHNKEVTMNSL